MDISEHLMRQPGDVRLAGEGAHEELRTDVRTPFFQGPGVVWELVCSRVDAGCREMQRMKVRPSEILRGTQKPGSQSQGQICKVPAAQLKLGRHAQVCWVKMDGIWSEGR